MVMELALVLLTAALVVTTLAYAVFTAKMVSEMRKTRQLSIRPRFGLLVRAVDPNVGLVEIRSLGPGTALHASLQLAQEPASNAEQRPWKAPVFSPGEKARLRPLAPADNSSGYSIQDLADAHVSLRLTGTMLDIDGNEHEVNEEFDAATWWGAIAPEQIFEADHEVLANRERERLRKAVERIEQRLQE
jgi:hypothetical protein